MSKKIIGPSLPPHLQHLINSTSEEVSGASDASSKYPSSSCSPKSPIDDNEDDSVLVLHVSEDEALADLEEPVPPILPPNFVSSSRSNSRVSKSSDEENLFGPTLPSSFKLGSTSNNCRIPESSDDEDLFGPLPPNFRPGSSSDMNIPVPKASDDELSFGPALPPSFKQEFPSNSSILEHKSSDDEHSFGPTLPPNFLPGSSSKKVIGPALPPGLQTSVGAELDPKPESDDEVVGPLPPSDSSSTDPSYIQQQLEARAQKMKRKLAGEDNDSTSRVQARETWMLELPPDRSGEFGLGPRQFRARAKLDLGDRSVWTDTPSDKERRENGPQQGEATSTGDLMSETDMIAIAERDRAMQKLTDKHNKKKRKESLVELHQKKLRKKQKKEEKAGKSNERRPFDRNIDLQANRFDEAQKKAILRKAQLLDDRFSRGESKFL